MISYTLSIEPHPWQRARTQGKRFFMDSKTRRFKTQVAALSRSHAPSQLLDVPLRLTAKFIFRKPKRSKFKNTHGVKPDLDNLLKGLKDALNGVIWTDDCRVCEYGEGTGKYYDVSGGYPRIELKIEELEDAR